MRRGEARRRTRREVPPGRTQPRKLEPHAMVWGNWEKNLQRHPQQQEGLRAVSCAYVFSVSSLDMGASTCSNLIVVQDCLYNQACLRCVCNDQLTADFSGIGYVHLGVASPPYQPFTSGMLSMTSCYERLWKLPKSRKTDGRRLFSFWGANCVQEWQAQSFRRVAQDGWQVQKIVAEVGKMLAHVVDLKRTPSCVMSFCEMSICADFAASHQTRMPGRHQQKHFGISA